MSLALQTPPRTNDFYAALTSQAAEIEARYRDLTPRSAELFARAGAVFPGGYTRDAVMRNPYATFVAKARGSILTDVDGREIVDLWFNATSLPLGHAHPAVVEAAEWQLRRGSAYYAPTEHELALAEILVERVPSAERIRFANSGSEAVMMALRFARAARGRSTIVKFEGSYHGSYDDVSWSVSPALDRIGEVAAPIPTPDTTGLAGTEGRLIVLPFNDVEVLRRTVTARHDEIAALVVEPMANRIGLVLPDVAFLAEARALCDHYGIVLVFDEVIAFRIGYHGAQGHVGVLPDLTTLGKIIGGGFASGAVAGKAAILDLSDPSRGERVTHAGTFNGNPMMAVAGRATIEQLTPETFERINALGAEVRRRLHAICDGLPLQVTGAGSLFKITATGRSIRNYRVAATSNAAWEQALSLALLNEGFLLTTACSGCVSVVTTQDEVEAFLSAVERIVRF